MKSLSVRSFLGVPGRRVGVLILALAAAPLPAFAQTPYGRITGRVTDSSGALVAGAPVRAVQLETNIATGTATSSEGIYEFPNLLPGNYRIAVEMQGFKRSERGPVELRVGDVLGVHLSLELGDVAETVTVSAEAPLLEASTASLSQTMDSRALTEMPLGGRAVTYLMQLAPNIVSTSKNPLADWNPQARAGVSQGLVAAGSGTGSSEFTLDGIPNMDHNGIMMFVPPPDMIQDYRVQTAAYDASVGHFSGAQVNMAIKAGANQLHGSLYFSHLSRPLMTNPFFVNRSLHDTRTGPPTKEKRNSLFPQNKTNRYRATILGPVVIPRLYDGRNRTFFSYGNEFMDNIYPGGGFQTVPTARQRQGDLSELLALGGQYQVYDPATIAPAPNGRFSRLPFAGNLIPRARLDGVAQKLLGFYPDPNVTGTADGRSNFSSPPANTIDWSSHMLRVDQVVSDRQRLYGSFATSLVVADQGRSFRNNAIGSLQDNRHWSLVMDDVLTLRPDLVVNLRAGFTRMRNDNLPVSGGIDLAALGFSARMLSQVPREFWALPGINIDGYTALNTNTISLSRRQFSYFGGHVTHLRGSHTLKMGGEWRLLQKNLYAPGRLSPSFDFGSTWTRGPLDSSAAAPIGQGLASFLLGLPTGGTGDRNDSYAETSHYTGFYIQDDWKVARNLTINAGLRHELELPTTERFNRANRGFDFAAASPIQAAALANYSRAPIPELPASQFRTLGGLLFAGVGGVPRGMWDTDKNNFLPRIGLAFQMRPKTVVRVGYGIFFTSIGVDKVSIDQQGFNQPTSIVPSFDNGLTFRATLADPFPDGLLAAAGASGGLKTLLGRAPSFMWPKRVPGYMQRWSLTIQQELPGRLLVEAGYMGNRGTHLAMDRNFNALPARYLSTSPARDQPTINFLTQQVTNPFFGLLEFTGTGLAARTVARQQLLTPMPHFTGVSTTLSDGFSWYHAGHLRMEKRMTRGYTLSAAYTWSKSMEAIQLLNPSDPAAHRSISSQDRPHHVGIGGTWDIPFGRGKLWGGWSVSGMFQWQSGSPISFGNIIFNGLLADIVLPRSQRNPDRWFKTDAGFNRNSPEQLASNIRAFPLRLTGLRTHEWNIFDISLVKNFRIGERVRFQLRADASDAFNHPIFSGPNTSPTSTLFGTVNSSIGPYQRQIEVIGKLTW